MFGTKSLNGQRYRTKVRFKGQGICNFVAGSNLIRAFHIGTFTTSWNANITASRGIWLLND